MNEQQRREWLISIAESAAFELDRIDWYDRIRYLRQILAMEVVNSNANRYVAGNTKIENKSNLSHLKGVSYLDNEN